jgi:hypothetical protein
MESVVAEGVNSENVTGLKARLKLAYRFVVSVVLYSVPIPVVLRF